MSHDKDAKKCNVCGEPLPPGEQMFKFHGHSGPCPKPPLVKDGIASLNKDRPGYANFRRVAERVAMDNSSLFRTKMTSDAVNDLVEDITACMCGVYEGGLERDCSATIEAVVVLRDALFSLSEKVHEACQRGEDFAVHAPQAVLDMGRALAATDGVDQTDRSADDWEFAASVRLDALAGKKAKPPCATYVDSADAYRAQREGK